VDKSFSSRDTKGLLSGTILLTGKKNLFAFACENPYHTGSWTGLSVMREACMVKFTFCIRDGIPPLGEAPSRDYFSGGHSKIAAEDAPTG